MYTAELAVDMQKRLGVPENSIRCVIFDCDGVMFDTARANQAYYNRILDHFGQPPMSEAQFAYAHMHTVDESMAFLFQDPELLQRADQYRRQMSYIPFFKYMAMEPHLKPLVKWLRPKIKTAVATNRTDTMARVLAQFDLADDFDLVVTASDVRHPKPHPEALNTIIERFKLYPDQALYIGDSSVDEAAARSAGVPFVAYRNRGLNALHHINSLKEIEGLLTLPGSTPPPSAGHPA